MRRGGDSNPRCLRTTVFKTGRRGVLGASVTGVVEDLAPPRIVYDPKNPAANEQGFVTMPNVNVVEEMVNMISASRAYQSNVEVMNTAKTLMQKTLALGQ